MNGNFPTPGFGFNVVEYFYIPYTAHNSWVWYFKKKRNWYKYLITWYPPKATKNRKRTTEAIVEKNSGKQTLSII